MLKVLKSWYGRYFSDREAVILFIVLAIIFGLIATMGSILAPILASIVIAYLLQGWTKFLEKLKLPRTPAYLIIYLAFITVFAIVILLFIPLVWQQIAGLFSELPHTIQKSKGLFLELSQKYPEFFSEQQINNAIAGIIKEIQSLGKIALSASVATIPGVVAFSVYLILIPMLVFFFLKDDKKIIAWCTNFLPKDRKLLHKVWFEIDKQLGNYVSGKFAEILIVGFVSYLVFLFFGLNYAILLATLVGLSVIVPYIGAIVVTIPVAVIAYIQWGWGSEFGYLILAYTIIQVLDGNLLVPILFSETLNLHPVAIVAAIVVFGSFWGFWGIFFAIPLATVVKTVINAWPRPNLYNGPRYNRHRSGRSRKNFRKRQPSPN